MEQQAAKQITDQRLTNIFFFFCDEEKKQGKK
jgi:hypothetical protein